MTDLPPSFCGFGKMIGCKVEVAGSSAIEGTASASTVKAGRVLMKVRRSIGSSGSIRCAAGLNVYQPTPRKAVGQEAGDTDWIDKMAWLVRVTRVLILAASTLGFIWQARRAVYGLWRPLGLS